MKNFLIVLVQATPLGPQVTQSGQIETSIGGPDGNFIVRFDSPKVHRRVLPSAALQQYTLFETPGQMAEFMTAVTPKPAAAPVVPQEQPKAEEPATSPSLEDTQRLRR